MTTPGEPKDPPAPLPKEGRLYGDVEGMQGYRRNLRHTVPVVDRAAAPPVGRPQWFQREEEESVQCRPLFEMLEDTGGEPEISPEEQLRLIHEAGRKEGYVKGLEEAKSAIEALVTRYSGALSDLETLREELVTETEIDVVNLSLLVAREAIRSEPESRRRFTEEMTVHCLKLLRSADRITLRIGPEDLEAIRNLPDAVATESTVVRLIEDPSITLGGVVAECALGRVDATFERRLSDIAQQLLGGEAVIRPAIEQELLEAAGPAPEAPDLSQTATDEGATAEQDAAEGDDDASA